MKILSKILILIALTCFTEVEATLTWSGSKVIGKGILESTPNLAMNDSHEVMAVWVGGPVSREVIKASFYSGNWSEPVNCSFVGRHYLWDPQVSLNNHKQALVVWKRFDGKKYSVNSAHFLDGSWDVPLQLVETLALVDSLQIALNDVGEAIAVWINQDNENYRVQASLYSNGKWEGPQFLSSQLTKDQKPESLKINVNHLGDMKVTWNTPNGALVQIAANIKNGTWSPLDALISPHAGALTQIVENNQGEAIAVWFENKSIQAACFSEKKWDMPVIIASQIEDAYGLNVVLNNNGNAIVSWQENWVIHAARKFKGVWSSPVVISQSGFSSFTFQQAALNDHEQGVIVYQAQETQDPSIPFPLPTPEYGFAAGFSQEKWEMPKLILSTAQQEPAIIGINTINFKLSKFGGVWAIAADKALPAEQIGDSLIQVVNGSF